MRSNAKLSTVCRGLKGSKSAYEINHSHPFHYYFGSLAKGSLFVTFCEEKMLSTMQVFRDLGVIEDDGNLSRYGVGFKGLQAPKISWIWGILERLSV